MSAFYARYIPPSLGASPPQEGPLPLHSRPQQPTSQTSSHAVNLKGTQRLLKGSTSKVSKHKKLKDPTDGSTRAAIPARKPKPGSEIDKDGQAVLQKYSVTGSAGARVARPARDEGASEPLRTEHASETGLEDAAAQADNKRKRKRPTSYRESDTQETQADVATATQDDGKHAAVYSRFQKAKSRATRSSIEGNMRNESPAVPEEVNELHGLEPIPQPEEAQKPSEMPSYSVLPPWLESPEEVSTDVSVSFGSLGLGASALSNLKTQNMLNAFPIQSTLIPLLTQGKKRYDGDICVSAATGSGKTLAYVLPMVEDLSQYAITKLRGVIIVPTRELVSQVRGVCDLCAMGTSVKVATAVGSKTLREEEEMLIRVDETYDPPQYLKERLEPVGWADLTLDKLFDSVKKEPYVDRLNYVERYSSKVDILVCTPGRLVDHLRSTAGFHLDDVTWLVIDEADRLLNESYQEWVEVVMPALQSRNATKMRDDILLQMRLELPPRDLRKIALSATMTRDISKLKSLDLRNPKLIVLGQPPGTNPIEVTKTGHDMDLKESEGGAFHLPELLSESAVGVDEGAEKPLYLLELLRLHTNILNRPSPPFKNTSIRNADTDTSSSASTSGLNESSGDEASDTSSSICPRVSGTKSHKGQDRLSPPHPCNISERALIFTRSSEAALRLSRLLTLLEPSLDSKISSLSRTSTSSASTRKAVQSFRQGKTAILIATDRASRGLDVPGLEHIISYDVPNSVNTYVHRVGRTARAGLKGTAYTLVAHREGRWFWKNIGGKGGNDQDKDGSIDRGSRKIKRLNIDLVLDEKTRERYEKALRMLGEEVRAK